MALLFTVLTLVLGQSTPWDGPVVSHVRPGHPGLRRLMTQDVNAAIRRPAIHDDNFHRGVILLKHRAEGGFEEEEIELAKEKHVLPITLGRRILRTETAGLAILSMMVLMLDE